MENTESSTSPRLNEEEKVLATFSYLGILCLIPLLSKKENPNIQFHAKQGLVIFIVWIVLFFINIIPFLGWMVWSMVSLLLGVVCIMAIVKIWQGEKWKIPFIYDYSKKVKI